METLSAGNKKIKNLQAYQRSAKDRREAGIFIAEGIKMFREAPADWIKEVYMTPDALDKISGARENSSAGEGAKSITDTGLPMYLVESEVFKRISDTRTPQGVLTVLKRPEYTLDGIISGISGHGKDVTADRSSGRIPLLLILENLQDPGNLGTILRVGEAAGVTGVIMSRGCVDIFNPKVIRSTMGSIYRMPFYIASDLAKTICELKKNGITTYAAHLKGANIYTDNDYRGATAFLIGNEGNGLTDEITALADRRVFIPMEGSVESLNAGISAAILSYEAHRQRKI